MMLPFDHNGICWCIHFHGRIQAGFPRLECVMIEICVLVYDLFVLLFHLHRVPEK